MDNNEKKYRKFGLVREMLEVPSILKNFSAESLENPIAAIKKAKRLFLTGEGSSRIFPSKNMIYASLIKQCDIAVHSGGARQAAEFSLKGFVLLGASNSGRTKEVISLFKKNRHCQKFALTGNRNNPLNKFSDQTFILNCGEEKAVSATKSVIEEALFCHNLLLNLNGKSISKHSLDELSKKSSKVLTMKIEDKIIKKLSKSRILYFAGRNNGVAEEAALKANEITRKKSFYLEGTYAVHGVEEAMSRNEAVIIIDPFREEEKKFNEVLFKGVGMYVAAISSRKTIFPTIRIPSMKGFDSYLQLLMCWNLLVEIGIRLGINLDRPKRARKIGNEI